MEERSIRALSTILGDSWGEKVRAKNKPKQADVNSFMQGVIKAPAVAETKAPAVAANPDAVKPSAKFGERPVNPLDHMPVYHRGTPSVKETGPALLKKGEAVIPAEHNPDNPANHAYELVRHPRKMKKLIDHVRIRKAKSGGFVMEHHHTAPGDHSMEEHVAHDMDAVHDHLESHMGTPNPGEIEADAGRPDAYGA